MFSNCSDKNRESNSKMRRRPADLKRTISVNSNNSVNHNNNSYEQDDDPVKVQLKSRVVTKESGIQRREQVIAMQSRQNDLERNKRMFGSLLGTLQRFKKEENILKSKEDKKAQIEKKVEEQELQEKIKLKQERDALIESRKRKQFEVKALETKMEKWRDLEIWEESVRHQVHFIKTTTKPEIFWQPKVFDDKTTELKSKTEHEINEKIAVRRKQVEDEIKAIEEHTDIENVLSSIDGHVKSENIPDHNGKGAAVRNENIDRGKNILVL